MTSILKRNLKINNKCVKFERKLIIETLNNDFIVISWISIK